MKAQTSAQYHRRQTPRLKNKLMVHACLIKDRETVGEENKTLKGLSHAMGLLASLTALVCSRMV